VGSLRRHSELIDDEIAAHLMAISAATIDGRLADDQAELVLKGPLVYRTRDAAEVSDLDQDLGRIG
jgi:hypothetical protein